MQLVCIRCGRPLVEGGSVGPLCLECFIETHRILCVPERLEFDYCRYCGSIRIGYKWVEGGELGEASAKFLERHLSEHVEPCVKEVESFRLESVEPLTAPSWRTMYRVVFSARLRGVDRAVRVSYTVEVRAKPTICPACKDARGGDYNVLLQVRGEKPAKLAKVLSPLLESSRQLANSIVDIVEYGDGVDFLLLDRGSASKIVRQLRKYYRVRLGATGEDVGITSRGRLRRRLVLSLHLLEERRR
ncbi:hypothetical protein CF15_06020 [Pyrodictium occultum]|uniref:Nmd3 N-terminal domain-containing protein n=1 Tax=Pyrodictium occultum TaxID=2309 RepID=A0A0V8RW83_PYROC|nr:60S ribosomal export protein NMD3 [Pyrodictium occultum]KSW12301.1 hypothetical protein CF15_06020 [Pyrodictium occultum]